MWTLLLSAALAGDALPAVTIDWERAVFALHVTAPPGEHINPEGPATLALTVGSQAWTIETDGAALEAGTLLFRSPGAERPIRGEAHLSICADTGDTCRPVAFTFAGTFPAARKGQGEPLEVAALAPVVEAPPEKKSLTLDEAFALARKDGKIVLFDFTAVWCPPCNQLRADVLHDPANAADISPFVIIEVDVDRPESWALKTRHAVGGYPTLVALTPDGAELGRTVGYVVEADFLTWLSGIASAKSPPPAPAAASPAAAAAQALAAASAQQEALARAYLARAASDAALQDSWTFRAARFLLDHDPKDARWLADKAPADALYTWVFDAIEPAQADPVLAAALRRAVQGAIGAAPPLKAADYLQVMAALAPPTEQRSWAAAAAKVMQATLSGDPTLDRGKYSPLADLLAQAGDPAGAIALLQQAAAAFPDEFTYHHALAGLYEEQGRHEEAQVAATAAYAASYGDNRLRAADRLARIEGALGHTEVALALIDRTIAETERPAAGLQVRTTRYLDTLTKTRAELASPKK